MEQLPLFEQGPKPLSNLTLRDWDCGDQREAHQAYADASQEEREAFARRWGLQWPTDFKPWIHLLDKEKAP